MVQTPIKEELGAVALPSGDSSLTKKRLFSEIETKEESNLLKSPLDDRFNSMILSQHKDLIKDPITLKRAPLNHEILEELEQIRINYKGAEEEL